MLQFAQQLLTGDVFHLDSSWKVPIGEHMGQAKVWRVHLGELIEVDRLGLVAVQAELKEYPDLLDPEVEVLELRTLPEDGPVVDGVELLHVVFGQLGQLFHVLVIGSETNQKGPIGVRFLG